MTDLLADLQATNVNLLRAVQERDARIAELSAFLEQERDDAVAIIGRHHARIAVLESQIDEYKRLLQAREEGHAAQLAELDARGYEGASTAHTQTT
jgi:hypothetical protein